MSPPPQSFVQGKGECPMDYWLFLVNWDFSQSHQLFSDLPWSSEHALMTLGTKSKTLERPSTLMPLSEVFQCLGYTTKPGMSQDTGSQT